MAAWCSNPFWQIICIKRRQRRNLDNRARAKCFQRIFGEFAFAHISCDFAREIVSAHTPEGYRPGLRAPFQRAEGVLFA